MNYDLLLGSLADDPEGLRGLLPSEFTFLGIPVQVFIQTEPIPRLAPRQPNLAELSLAREILENLTSILQRSEAALRIHFQERPEFIAAASDPCIWINEEAIELDGPKRWTFVVGNSQNESYGTHVEFDGLEVCRVWSGD